MQPFTRDDLAACHGRDSAPAFVAYRGRVYDVGGSFLWRRGRHQALHDAGADLTEALAGAPHGDDVLDGFPVVGFVVDGSEDRRPVDE